VTNEPYNINIISHNLKTVNNISYPKGKIISKFNFNLSRNIRYFLNFFENLNSVEINGETFFVYNLEDFVNFIKISIDQNFLDQDALNENILTTSLAFVPAFCQSKRCSENNVLKSFLLDEQNFDFIQNIPVDFNFNSNGEFLLGNQNFYGRGLISLRDANSSSLASVPGTSIKQISTIPYRLFHAAKSAKKNNAFVVDNTGRYIFFIEQNNNISCYISASDTRRWFEIRSILQIDAFEKISHLKAIINQRSNTITLFYSINDSFLMQTDLDANQFSVSIHENLFRVQTTVDDVESSFFSLPVNAQAIFRSPSRAVMGDPNDQFCFDIKKQSNINRRQLGSNFVDRSVKNLIYDVILSETGRKIILFTTDKKKFSIIYNLRSNNWVYLVKDFIFKEDPDQGSNIQLPSPSGSSIPASNFFAKNKKIFIKQIFNRLSRDYIIVILEDGKMFYRIVNIDNLNILKQFSQKNIDAKVPFDSNQNQQQDFYAQWIRQNIFGFSQFSLNPPVEAANDVLTDVGCDYMLSDKGEIFIYYMRSDFSLAQFKIENKNANN